MGVIMKLILIVLVGLCATKAEHKDKVVRRGNGKFANDVAEKLLKSDNNAVFSPFSAHAALSMLYQGAGGTTKEALQAALHLNDPADTAEGYHIVLNDLNSDNEQIDVKVANKVYVKPAHTLKPEFTDAIQNYFHSDCESLDFAQNEAAAKQINTWVEDHTNNKIHDLLQAEDLSVDTHIVLLNAFYFKGSWFYPFDKQYTQDADFHVNAETKVQVPMMSTSGRFVYEKNEKLGAEVVILPFQNTNYTFMIIVPIEKNGVDEVLNNMLADNNDFGIGARIVDIDLSLPRFKLSQTIDMEDLLKQMGLSDLFDSGKCDLTNMFTNSEDIYVSKAVQKTYIDVNELGCEAAAASAIVGTGRSLHIQVTVDHPFLFSITHQNEHKFDMLMMGKVVNPAENDI